MNFQYCTPIETLKIQFQNHELLKFSFLVMMNSFPEKKLSSNIEVSTHMKDISWLKVIIKIGSKSYNSEFCFVSISLLNTIFFFIHLTSVRNPNKAYKTSIAALCLILQRSKSKNSKYQDNFWIFWLPF